MSSGHIIGLARRAVSREPMEEIKHGLVTPEIGLLGDCKGLRFPLRHLTIMAKEDWEDTIASLDCVMGPIELPWTTRRANVFTQGIDLPKAEGSILALGSAMVEVTEETTPCAQMDVAYRGLRRALAPHWRGGITCKVLTGGGISIGDRIEVLSLKVRRRAYLPG